jgi:hypothetical protein
VDELLSERENIMATAWRNKRTGLWLVQNISHTHTGEHKKFSETKDLNKASLLAIPDYQIRRSNVYEPVEVVVVKHVTIKDT